MPAGAILSQEHGRGGFGMSHPEAGLQRVKGGKVKIRVQTGGDIRLALFGLVGAVFGGDPGKAQFAVGLRVQRGHNLGQTGVPDLGRGPAQPACRKAEQISQELAQRDTLAGGGAGLAPRGIKHHRQQGETGRSTSALPCSAQDSLT